jgi:hypothetical protein
MAMDVWLPRNGPLAYLHRKPVDQAGHVEDLAGHKNI